VCTDPIDPLIFIFEFDLGSPGTLATCLIHASLIYMNDVYLYEMGVQS